MPEERTKQRARKDKAQGKAPSTQAGEFVREEIDHVREGKHGARSTKQAIAIGLSKARRAGVNLPQPKAGTTSARTRKAAARDSAKGHEDPNHEPSATRSRANQARPAARAARNGIAHRTGSPSALRGAHEEPRRALSSGTQSRKSAPLGNGALSARRRCRRYSEQPAPAALAVNWYCGAGQDFAQ
jgi:Family of unknown function (DUF6496)